MNYEFKYSPEIGLLYYIYSILEVKKQRENSWIPGMFARKPNSVDSLSLMMHNNSLSNFIIMERLPENSGSVDVEKAGASWISAIADFVKAKVLSILDYHEQGNEGRTSGSLSDILKLGRDSASIDSIRAWLRAKLPQELYMALMHFGYEWRSFEAGNEGLFSSVAIETTTRCNRRCGYCPLSDPEKRRLRPEQEISDELFSAVIDELASHNFKGKLALHGYGEPLLDSKIVSRIRLARSKLPGSYITINSNGDFLDLKMLEDLIKAGISHIYVTQHSSDKVPPIIAVRDNPSTNPAVKKIIGEYVSFWSKLVKLQNRGGAVDLSKYQGRIATKKDRERCVSNAHTMTVNIDGTVSLCDNDYDRTEEDIMGRVVPGNTTMRQVWESERFRRARKKLIAISLGLASDDEAASNACKKCNIG